MCVSRIRAAFIYAVIYSTCTTIYFNTPDVPVIASIGTCCKSVTTSRLSHRQTGGRQLGGGKAVQTENRPSGREADRTSRELCVQGKPPARIAFSIATVMRPATDFQVK